MVSFDIAEICLLVTCTRQLGVCILLKIHWHKIFFFFLMFVVLVDLLLSVNYIYHALGPSAYSYLVLCIFPSDWYMFRKELCMGTFANQFSYHSGCSRTGQHHQDPHHVYKNIQHSFKVRDHHKCYTASYLWRSQAYIPILCTDSSWEGYQSWFC